jgi:hypothetical protein
MSIENRGLVSSIFSGLMQVAIPWPWGYTNMSQERGDDAHEGNIDSHAQTPHCTAGITTGLAVGIPTW